MIDQEGTDSAEHEGADSALHDVRQGRRATGAKLPPVHPRGFGHDEHPGALDAADGVFSCSLTRGGKFSQPYPLTLHKLKSGL